MGFTAIDGAILSKLKVRHTAFYVNGPPAPLYCVASPQLTEDYDLEYNIEESSGKWIGADPRIEVEHIKHRGIPSWGPRLYAETLAREQQRAGGSHLKVPANGQ